MRLRSTLISSEADARTCTLAGLRASAIAQDNKTTLAGQNRGGKKEGVAPPTHDGGKRSTKKRSLSYAVNKHPKKNGLMDGEVNTTTIYRN
jgi:hypothetical protein